MSKNDHPEPEPAFVLLQSRGSRLFAVKIFLAWLFMFSLLWTHPARAGEFPPAAAAGATAGAGAGAERLRTSHSAKFTLNGFAGWQDSNSDPTTDRSSAACNLATVHIARTPLPVLGGRLLVAGWVLNRRLSASAELYDSSTDSWLESGSLTSTMDNRNSMFPRSSRILVWGGIIIPF